MESLEAIVAAYNKQFPILERTFQRPPGFYSQLCTQYYRCGNQQFRASVQGGLLEHANGNVTQTMSIIIYYTGLPNEKTAALQLQDLPTLHRIVTLLAPQGFVSTIKHVHNNITPSIIINICRDNLCIFTITLINME